MGPPAARPRLAVIGAGLAGLACARVAAEAGLRVQIFEKSRGIGGRLATRRPFGREDPFGLDHGAPYAEPPDNGWEAFERVFAASDAVAEWDPAPAGARIGLPGMSDFARPLTRTADGTVLSIAFETEITEIAAGPEDWLLRDAGGAAHGPFDAVALAAPAPQSRALLGGACPEAETAAAMAPALTLLLVFEAPLPGAPPGGLIPPRAPFTAIIRNGAKPGRADAKGREGWIAHADADSSAAMLEQEKDAIAAALLPRFFEALGLSAETAPRPLHQAGHRWRYAQVAEPIGRAYWLSAPDAALPGPLGACGDWRLGPKAGHALESGSRLGAALTKRLSPSA